MGRIHTRALEELVMCQPASRLFLYAWAALRNQPHPAVESRHNLGDHIEHPSARRRANGVFDRASQERCIVRGRRVVRSDQNAAYVKSKSEFHHRDDINVVPRGVQTMALLFSGRLSTLTPGN
jgi:hypothetical protein